MTTMGPTGGYSVYFLWLRAFFKLFLLYAIHIRLNRRIWTNEEDEAIRQMVMKYGTKSWALIAENLSKEHSIAGRSGKQCRERWHNHLGTSILLLMYFNLHGSSDYVGIL